MAEIILAILQPLIKTFGGYLVNPIKNQLSYLCCYSCNVQRLTNEVPELTTKRESVQQAVNAARVNLEDIEDEVLAWQSKVEEVQTKSNRICNDAAEAQKSCLSKWCPLLHYSLSREAQKTTETLIKLRNTQFEKISKPGNRADLEPIPPKFEQKFQSRDIIEEKIMDALKDDSVYSIGLCGMGGGRQQWHEKLREGHGTRQRIQDLCLQRLLWQQSLNSQRYQKIQQEIAEGLGLQLEYKSLTMCAKLLHARLMAAGNVLVILDDVWERLNLDEIGIPKSTHAGSKLLLTSRSRTAITSTVEDAKVIPLEILNEEESWDLFRENVGDSIASPDLHQIATEVVAECKGLPLALVTLGRTLRADPTESSWNDILRRLRQSIPTNIPDAVKDVYRPLRVSFDRLEGEEYKYLFLLCCLFPEDFKISIEELVRWGIGLEIFEGVEDLRRARDAVKRTVNYLITRSLLIESGTDYDWGYQCVRMHDVIRDMGIWIASEGKHVFMISHGKKKWPKPKEDSYANYTCISLRFRRVDIGVPECIDCPRLEFLSMDFRSRVKLERDYCELPENIFGGMPGLKVLEVSGIKSLPPSVDLLKGLRTLRLSYCELEKTSVIGELMSLEILCLDYCEFEVLQKEIGGLRKLRKLKIFGCRNLRRIEYGVVSGLVQLEELVILESFRNWKAEQKDDASLFELDSLSYLNTLYIEISDPNIIPERTPDWAQKETKYFISVLKPRCMVHSGKKYRFEFSKAITVGRKLVIPLGSWFHEMAMKAKYLNLEGLSCTEIVRLVRSGCPNLEYLQLCNYDNVQYLSDTMAEGQQNDAIFPILKCLILHKSSSLQGISNCQPPVGSFQALEEIRLEWLPMLRHLWIFPVSNLKTIVIKGCRRLLDLFPLSMAQSLSQLEELEVSDCQVLEEIFKKEEGGMEIRINKIEFLKLYSLNLKNLPIFRGFCKGADKIEVPTLCKLKICNVPGIIRECDHDLHQQFLFDKQLSGILITPPIIFNFSRLQELAVHSFHNIKTLFSPSILSGFPNLRGLSVENCIKLEEVIGNDENVGSPKTKTTLFPKLTKLVLSELPRILAFCHSTDSLELPSLRDLRIANCPLMETFVMPFDVRISRCSKNVSQPFFGKEVFCHKLNRLVLEGLNIAGTLSQSISIDTFCELESLTIISCLKLTNLFSPHVFRGLRNIKRLNLRDCGELQEVIAKEDEERPTNMKETLSFQLEDLRLSKIPKMRRFCYMNDDLEFPSLDTLAIENCPMLETFTLGSLHLPSLKIVDGDLDPDIAAKLLFNEEKSSDKIDLDSNCFTLSARNLLLHICQWGSFNWLLARDSSDSFVSIVEVRTKASLEIRGNLEMEKLTAGVIYEIIFVIMLQEYAGGWEEPVELKLTKAGGIAQHRTEILYIKPRKEWIEILVGEFTREPHQIGQLEFSLNNMDEEYKSGLIIKCAKIRQKA